MRLRRAKFPKKGNRQKLILPPPEVLNINFVAVRIKKGFKTLINDLAGQGMAANMKFPEVRKKGGQKL